MWNIIKHEKAKYTKFLCLLNAEGEYSLHHQFFQSIADADADENCVSIIVDFVLKRGNPFDTNYCTTLINIVMTNANIKKESEQFLLNCINIGTEACKSFIATRFEQKNI